MAEGAEIHNAKILVVDDLLFTRKMLKDLLEENGYAYVLEAEDGATAIEAYRVSKPDLVLMDVVMPRVDGIDALKQIKQTDPQAKIIMVSAVGQESVIKEAMQLGAAGYIVKPFKPEEIVATIGRVLKGEERKTPKILVVDDLQFARKVLKEMLAKAGYSDFIESDNGDNAVALYIAQKPDLVLLDIVMPISGMEALRQIMESDPDARIIVVTAVGQISVMKEATHLGARAYLVKPLKEEAVVKAVKEQLGGKK